MLFIHAADLHLGCAEHPLARKVRHQALENLVTLCLTQAPQALLLAGDLFDSPHPPKEEADFFFSQMNRLKIPVVMVAGNHDPLLPGSIWEDARTEANDRILLSTKGECVEFNDFRIYGTSFSTHTCTDSLLDTVQSSKWEGVNLLLMHGDVTSPSSISNPLPTMELGLNPFDYIALGHIHKTMQPRMAGENLWSYAGTLSGHGFDEPGPHGCMLVQAQPGRRAKARFQSLSQTWFETLDFSVQSLKSEEEIRENLLQLLYEKYAQPEQMFLHIRLTGRILSSLKGVGKTLNETLSPRFSLLEIEDNTRPLFDLDALRKERTLRGAFVREMEKQTPFNERALLLGLEAFEEQ